MLYFFTIIFSLLLTSCHTIYPTHEISVTESEHVLQESIDVDKDRARPPLPLENVPANINSSLLPPMSNYVHRYQNEQPRFDVNANNVPAREFFMGLVTGTKYNMVVHPSITGTITLTLKNVTIQQAMSAVRDIYGYEYRHTNFGYEVVEPQLETQIFHLNYIDVQRTGRSYMQLTTGQVSNKIGTINTGATSAYGTPLTANVQGPPEGIGTISSVETKTIMEFWKTIESTIAGMLDKKEGHNVSVNALAGVISVRAFPTELHRIGHYIKSLQNSLSRQVILEAKILEVELDDGFESGIDWNILTDPGKPDTSAGIIQRANTGVEGTEIKPFKGIFTFRINGQFSVIINLLQTQGNVQVLSSPHISTVNNQKAVIKVGQDEFFVTGVSTSNTIIGTNTIPSQDVSLTPFFSGITLDVTPEISGRDDVILHIHPSVSRVTEQTKVIGLGATSDGSPNNLTLPLAFSTIRESDNIVRAKNGQVIVIGGLMQNHTREIIAETPWIGKIPFLGFLFRRTKQTSVKSELVILLRPIVASNHNEIEKMEEAKKVLQIYRRPMHTGGLARVFGNEAERADNN